MSLSARQRYAVDMATGGHPADATRNLLIARGTGWDPDALRIILDKRAAYLDALSVTQRRWQRLTRRQDRANQYDSVATRERYVRCAESIPPCYQRPYIVAPHQDRQGRNRWRD